MSKLKSKEPVVKIGSTIRLPGEPPTELRLEAISNTRGRGKKSVITCQFTSSDGHEIILSQKEVEELVCRK